MKFGSGLMGKLLALALLVGVGAGISSPAEAGDWSDWSWLFDWLNQGRNPVQVPEPATVALLVTGAAAMGFLRRRRKQD